MDAGECYAVKRGVGKGVREWTRGVELLSERRVSEGEK